MAEQIPSDAGQPDEFYVGYLPLPGGHRRFLRLLLPAMLWLMVGAAALIAHGMRDAGRGQWNPSERRSFTGMLEVSPYPLLRRAVASPPIEGTVPASVLLVEAGKLGGRAGLESMHGRSVRVSGSLLVRDGRAMIELAPGPEAVHADDASPQPLPKRSSLGRTTLRGEIVDSKCYLGAMRPGDGKTHRACAQLCIAGGLPPMLVTRDPEGNASCFVLTGPDGEAANAMVGPCVAEPVEVSGSLERVDELMYLRVDPDGIRPL